MGEKGGMAAKIRERRKVSRRGVFEARRVWGATTPCLTLKFVEADELGGWGRIGVLGWRGGAGAAAA